MQTDSMGNAGPEVQSSATAKLSPGQLHGGNAEGN